MARNRHSASVSGSLRKRGLITTDVPSLVDRALGPYVALRGNRPFTLLVIAHALSVVIDWLYVVALFILAFHLTRSPTVVALLTFTRLLPYALLLPLSGAITDRLDPRTLMVCANIGRALAVGALTTIHTTSGLPLAFFLVFVATAFSSLFRPALLASVPTVVPERRLVEANSVLGQLDMAAFGGGPAIAGFILLGGQPETALLFASGGLLASALAVFLARLPRHVASADVLAGPRSVLQGLRFLARENERVLLGIALAWAGLTFFGGAYWTLSIVLAERAFGLGDAGVGFINAGYAVGGLLGGFLVAQAIARFGPAVTFVAATAASSIAEALFGLSPAGALPFLFFFLTGLADSVAKITATTGIQAATPRALLGRVFGAFESLFILAMAAGALTVGPLIALLGARTACASIAGIGFVLLVAALPFLVRMDRVLGVRVFLYRVPVLNLLPLELMEEVVEHLRAQRYRREETIVQQGDRGDAMYLIRSGTVEVVMDADGGAEMVAVLSRGDYFGEIALLEDVPRTATCRCRTDVEVYAMGREDFQRLLARSTVFDEAVRAESIARAAVSPRLLRLHA